MALDLAEIRAQLKEALTNNIARTVNVYAVIPDRPIMLPAVILTPASEYVDYQGAFSKGLSPVEFDLRLYAQGTEAGQVLLDDMLSAGTGKDSSVIDALVAAKDNTGQPWSDVLVRSARWADRVLLGDSTDSTPAYAAVISIAVYTPRR